MRIVQTFDRITLLVKGRFPCSTCDRQMTRQTTLKQTVNPFNKNAQGGMQEIRLALDQQARDWTPQEVLCPACRKTEGES